MAFSRSFEAHEPGHALYLEEPRPPVLRDYIAKVRYVVLQEVVGATVAANVGFVVEVEGLERLQQLDAAFAGTSRQHRRSKWPAKIRVRRSLTLMSNPSLEKRYFYPFKFDVLDRTPVLVPYSYVYNVPHALHSQKQRCRTLLPASGHLASIHRQAHQGIILPLQTSRSWCYANISN